MSETEDLDVDPKNDIVPVQYWGKDHWSTLLYLEHCFDEKGGFVDKQRMRCNPRLHRELANVSPMGKLVDGGNYPTRLCNGQELESHDDWSCVEDMVAYGLVEVEADNNEAKRVNDGPFGYVDVCVSLTEEGRAVAEQARNHRENDGKLSDFRPDIVMHKEDVDIETVRGSVATVYR